ncbi:hypothetical protein VTI74DRAFT_8190 [Chaetomium olivicolor]
MLCLLLLYYLVPLATSIDFYWERIILGEPGWPSLDEWNKFNEILGGALLKPVALGAARYPRRYKDVDKCEFLFGNGGYPVCAINATTVKHNQLAINFGRDRHLRLVIKDLRAGYLGHLQGLPALASYDISSLKFQVAPLSNFSSSSNDTTTLFPPSTVTDLETFWSGVWLYQRFSPANRNAGGTHYSYTCKLFSTSFSFSVRFKIPHLTPNRICPLFTPLYRNLTLLGIPATLTVPNLVLPGDSTFVPPPPKKTKRASVPAQETSTWPCTSSLD